MPNGTKRAGGNLLLERTDMPTSQVMPIDRTTGPVPSLLSGWRWLVLVLLFIDMTLGMGLLLLFHLSLAFTLLIVTLFVLVGCILGCMSLVLSIVNTLMHPRRDTPLIAFPATLPVEKVQFPSSKGNRQVHGFFIKRPGASTAIIVIASHDVLPIVTHLWEAGHHVLVFSAYGHTPIVSVPDFLGAIAYARRRMPSAWLGAFGSSTEGTVCILGSACAPEIEAVVADSAFATHDSATLVALHHMLRNWPRFIIRLLHRVTSQALWLRAGRKLEPVQEIKKLARPILLIHSLTSTNACPRDAQLLYQAAGKPKALWLLKCVEHSMSSPAYITRVTEFFERHLKQRPTEEAHRQVLPDPMVSVGDGLSAHKNASGTQKQVVQKNTKKAQQKQGRDERSLKGTASGKRAFCPLLASLINRLTHTPDARVVSHEEGSSETDGEPKECTSQSLSIHHVNKQECPAAPLGQQEQITQAQAYLRLLHQGELCDKPLDDRLSDIRTQIKKTGTYQHTSLELKWGARIAWRNSTRCTGRLHWESLDVRDMRYLTRAEDIFEACLEHIRLASNGGKIRSLMTVFAPGIRIWNPQLIRYAGYELKNGRVIGDPAHVELTNALFQLGWKGGKGTPFDILPLVIQMPDQKPRRFELPPEIVLEVPIEHPDYPWFANLGLKWHALPAISNMRLEIGGISYTAAPFNGWYLSTEIGARNLADQHRYNMLPVIAEKLGLDRRQDRTLWKDRALIELNVAVLSSFARCGVTMVDHHTVARQLVVHEEKEKQAGRCMFADWGWIVPPMSGSTTPVFHRSYENKEVRPNFFSQPDPWKVQNVD